MLALNKKIGMFYMSFVKGITRQVAAVGANWMYTLLDNAHGCVEILLEHPWCYVDVTFRYDIEQSLYYLCR